MRRRGLASPVATAACAIVAIASFVVGATGAAAQQRPADPTVLPPVPTDYTPKKTSWGDYDFSATWQIENINAALKS